MAKKLIIVLLGTSRFSNSPKIGGFLRVPGFEDPIWQGKLFEIEEFNEVAQTVIDKQANLRLPPASVVSVRVVDEIVEEEVKELLGEEYVPEGHDPQTYLQELLKQFFPCSPKDWNNLDDVHRKNLVRKFSLVEIEEEDDEQFTGDKPPASPDSVSPTTESAPENTPEPASGPTTEPEPETIEQEKISEESTEPSGEEETSEETETQPNDEIAEEETEEETEEVPAKGEPYDRAHRGRGKYDVYDKDGNVVADNVTKEEAYELVPTRPNQQ